MINAHSRRAGCWPTRPSANRFRRSQSSIPRPKSRIEELVLPGTLASLRRVADLRPHQRLSAALVQGHRQPRHPGRTAGRHRYAGSGPGVDAGRAPTGSRSWPRWTWPRSMRRSLRDPAQDRFGFAAGSRPADQRIPAEPRRISTAADANVRRLEQLESFKHVYAPFSGVLTKRNVDPGALINAGTAAAKSCSTSRRSIRFACMSACPRTTRRPSRSGWTPGSLCRNFPARSSRVPWRARRRRLILATRTLLTEVDVPNQRRTTAARLVR